MLSGTSIEEQSDEAILVTRTRSVRGDLIEIPRARSGRLRRIAALAAPGILPHAALVLPSTLRSQ